MPPYDPSKPFTRSDAAHMAGVTVAAFSTLARRGQLPFFDDLELTAKLTEAQANLRTTWTRYSPFQMFQLVAVDQLHTGNSGFPGLSWEAASKIVNNCVSGVIVDAVRAGVPPRLLYAGYVWVSENGKPMGGGHIAGTMADIVARQSQMVSNYEGSSIRSVALLNIGTALTVYQQRMAELGYDPDEFDPFAA